MPYKVVKVSGGYKVKKLDDGKFMSSDPLPKFRAEAQLRALYASENKTTKEASFDRKLSAIREAIAKKVNPETKPGIPYSTGDFWVRDIYRDYVILQKESKTYRANYTWDQETGDLELSPMTEVEILWVPVSKEVSATPTAVMGHGAGGTFSIPGVGGAVRPTRKFGKKRKPYTDITRKHLSGQHNQKTHEWKNGAWHKKELAKDNGESLAVFKDRNGQWRWITFSSTAYRDGDGEIVSTKALTNDVDRADQDGNYGPLRWWHIEGADIGDCDFNMMKGRILIESGTFRNDRIAHVVKEKSKNLRVSIGFRHPATEPDSEGVFHTIRRFERSLLPAGKASNYFTRVVVKGVNDMTDLNEKVKALRALLGDDELVDGILSSAEITEKEADGLGVVFKELGNKLAEKAKKPAPKKVEEEVDPMDESETEDEVEVEEEDETEEKAKKAKPQPKPEPEPEELEDEADETDEDLELEDEDETNEEDEDEKKELDEPSYIGDMPVPEFVSAMSESLAHALEPYIRSVENLATEVVSVKELLTRRTKELSNQETAVKEATSRLDKTEKELKRANARLAELEGSQPAVVKRGYSASQAEDTIISDERVKSAGPQSDPFAAFTENFVLKP